MGALSDTDQPAVPHEQQLPDNGGSEVCLTVVGHGAGDDIDLYRECCHPSNCRSHKKILGSQLPSITDWETNFPGGQNTGVTNGQFRGYKGEANVLGGQLAEYKQEGQFTLADNFLKALGSSIFCF